MRNKQLAELQQKNAACSVCQLRSNCNQVVCGRGSPYAKLMLVGDMPSRDDDLTGEPFSDRSGDLLDKIFKKIGLNKSDLYLAHCVRCGHHPKGRQNEICKQWLWKEIKLIQPKIIVTLGKISTQLLIGTKSKTLIGTRYEKNWGFKIVIIPMYHPTYVLRRGREVLDAQIEIYRTIMENINEYQ